LRKYNNTLQWSINNRKAVLIVTAIALVLSIIVLATRGGDFFPHSDQGYIVYEVKRAPGTSLDEMDKSMKQIGKIIKQEVPEAENIRLEFGQGEGIGALFGGGSSNEGEVGIKLVKLSKRTRRQKKSTRI